MVSPQTVESDQMMVEPHTMVSDQMMVLPQTIVSPKRAALPQVTLLFVAFGSPLSMNATPPAVTVCPAMTV